MQGVNETVIAAWLKSLPGTNRTRKNSLDNLKAVLGHFGTTTAQKPPKTRKGVRRPLSPQEDLILEPLAKKIGAKAHLAYVLARDCGLRRGEICGLAFEDIEDGGLNVRRSVVWTKAQIVVKGVKTEEPRWVPMTDEVVRLIGSGKGFVLGSGSTPLNPKTLSSWFHRIKKDSGLSVPFLGLHSLRRTYGFGLLESGTDIKTAAEMMGHDPAMLLNVYSKSRRDLKKAAIKRLGITRGITEEDNYGKSG